ncbi:amino acid ABC transporter membrane protein (PAAT family) [Nocardioides sp. J9]|uniref:amino acid ABC transporter permease n=1 Tax=Nocardioides sp. J9 TaxID=935844 RepID=UPI0011AD88A9|nr:amino acid ABC transporter permease [Nocardioides sp. J9]TWH01752.1 amino acid ABC transporter membrane protein (PAAT family) [Nocardioides sp. J9]
MNSTPSGGYARSDASKIVPTRKYGQWVSLAVLIAVIALLVSAFAKADIDYGLIPEYIFDPLIVTGVVNTIKLTVVCMAVGVALGTVFAIMGQSSNLFLRTVAGLYRWLFRAVPVLVQLLIWFNLGIIFQTISIPGVFSVQTNEFITPWVAAVLGLGIAEGAYMSEIVRGGLISVGNGQREAAQAVGMTGAMTMRRVVLPQALRVIIPPTGNEAIGMLKFTSLAYIVSYSELLSSATRVYQTNLKVMELLFVASIWYIALTTLLMIGQYFLERRFGRGFAASKVKTKTATRG